MSTMCMCMSGACFHSYQNSCKFKSTIITSQIHLCTFVSVKFFKHHVVKTTKKKKLIHLIQEVEKSDSYYETPRTAIIFCKILKEKRRRRRN